MTYALLGLLDDVLTIYWWIVIIAVMVSWLVGFGVINTYHPMTRSALRALDALTAPVFEPIRRIIPAMGGLDLSPMIVLLLITFLQRWLRSGSIL